MASEVLASTPTSPPEAEAVYQANGTLLPWTISQAAPPCRFDVLFFKVQLITLILLYATEGPVRVILSFLAFEKWRTLVPLCAIVRREIQLLEPVSYKKG